MSDGNLYNKIAVIGKTEIVSLFRAVGVVVYPAESPEEARDALAAVLKEGAYGVVFITEDFLAELGDAMRVLEGKPLPAVLGIPAPFGETEIGQEKLKNLAVRAIGSDISV